MDDDTYDPDLEAEAAAMAEAMGFTGFGGVRNKKRKFNPNADSSVAEEPAVPSFTGANTAPLGRRRQMNLPPPAGSEGGANADEIDLDEGEGQGEEAEDWAGRPGGGGDHDGVAVAGNVTEPPLDIEGTQVRINTILASNANPTAQNHQHHQQSRPHPHPHSTLPNPPQRWSGQHTANAARAAKAAGLPWWEGPWDPKLIDRMIDNPWDRLEKQRGLSPRETTWGRKDDGGETSGGGSGGGGGAQAGGGAAGQGVEAVVVV